MLKTTTVKIKQCVYSDEMECLGNLDELIDNVDIELLFINTNFQPNIQDDPISYFFDNRLNQEIVKGMKKQFNV